MIKLRYCHNMWVVGGLCGYGGSVWVMGEWAVGQWIVCVTSFQKIYGLYGLNILLKVLQWKNWSDDGHTETQTNKVHFNLYTRPIGRMGRVKNFVTGPIWVEGFRNFFNKSQNNLTKVYAMGPIWM